MADGSGDFRQCSPFQTDFSTNERSQSAYTPLHTFDLPRGADKHYQQQYADMYFLRLAQLKPAVEEQAEEAWGSMKIGSDTPQHVDRVLDVRQGIPSWVVGTVFVDMPLKPNVLDDISKDHWISAPPTRERYTTDGKLDMMIEDESGRLKIIGDGLDTLGLVTGCVIAILGHENIDGVFNVIDTKYADLPRQPERWEKDEASLALSGGKVKQKRPRADRVAIISGLEISGDSGNDLALVMLTEYLIGESSHPSRPDGSKKISRLIVAGGSLAHSSPIPSREEVVAKKGHKKYGYDSAAYDASPTARLDTFLSDILPTLPVTLLPGVTDPASVAIPQQPLHAALFPQSRALANSPALKNDPHLGFDSVSNPWEGDIDGWRFLGTGGQTVTDVQKYLDVDSTLDIMDAMLRWRCIAPTAPDTLWCYPFQEDDPLLVKECPHVYFAGNMPKFDFRTETGPLEQTVTLISVPKYSETGIIVFLDMETLEVTHIELGVGNPKP
ncbi:DNA polymeras-like protein subunit delta-2 [Mytilinidion resinicola]|uniref:DNA-directed DNA polymerase n=1 Tax=Mytilinidion resinicola TaxID=574789 RepID=A0A6A6YM31_9PEZI|nr:DNA polymeras-like protein subunit delta-2 [Mytilinidion resinicola]KAF2809936.1 DNA polymeras-like protein subunit delta-2 [Mytilinidion resinicola]